ncbi:MAG: protein kinase [Kofleriaceae bacterium]
MESLDGLPLGDELGSGGFAAVYPLGDKLVVKIAHVAHDLAKARIAREADALRAAGAPAVPQLHGTGVLPDGRAWLAMQKIAGTNLADVTTEGPLPHRAAVQLGMSILESLSKIHASGFVHRDLKPDNLVRNPETRICILDLGLARKIPRDPDDPTRANVQVGSLEYMPPEQILDSASVDERSDLYAFGCVLFELIAGRPPFVGDAAALERAHQALRPPRLDSLVEVPNAIDQLVQDCLAKDPARRPGSAARARALLAQTQDEGRAYRTGTQPISIIRESKQPVVIVYAELPRIDRALLGMFSARRLSVVSQRGRRVIAAAIGGEHGDPAAVAIAAARDLAAAGARVALHLEALRVANNTPSGEAIEKPETWLPAQWTGVILTRAMASVVQTSTREIEGGFRVLEADGAQRAIDLVGRDKLLDDLIAEAQAALIGSVTTAPATGPVVVTPDGVPQMYLSTRQRVGGPGFALVVGDAGVGKTMFAAELARRVRELDVDVHFGTLPLAGSGAQIALGELVAGASGTRAIGDALRARARKQPLAVILDDLHLADHALLDALEYATLGGESLPLWVVGIAAPRIDARRANLGSRAERHRRDELKALDEDSAVALAAKLLEPAEYPPLRALRRLAAIAHGNPLHITTLTRELHDRGAVRQRAGGAHFFDTTALDELSPAALGPWLAARELSGLAVELVALARICAVLGSDDPFKRDEVIAIVEAVEAAGGATTTIDPGVGLAELEDAGLLISTNEVYQFRQSLVAEGIYATTDEAERLAIHRAALEFWRRSLAGDAKIARHAEAVGDQPTAARAYAAMARATLTEHDVEAAWQGALRNLPALDADHVRALMGRADARARQQRMADALVDGTRAVELATPLDHALLLEAHLELSLLYDRADEYPKAKELGELALSEITPEDPPRLHRIAKLALGRIKFRDNQTADAVPILREVSELAYAADDFDVAVPADLLLGPSLVTEKQLVEAEVVFDRVVAVTTKRDDRFHLGVAYANRAWLWSAQGAIERTAADLRLVIQLAREIGATLLERIATYNLAEDRLWQGALDESLLLARRSLTLQTSYGEGSTKWDRMLLARVLAAKHDVAELQTLLPQFAADELAPDEKIVVDIVAASTTDTPADQWDNLLDQTTDLPGGNRLEMMYLAARAGRLDAKFRSTVADLIASNTIWSARAHEF